MSIKEIKVIVGGTVLVPATHAIDLTEATEIQKIHRVNGNKVVNSALAFENSLSEEIARFFVRSADTGLKELLKALVLETSHFDFMGKIRAYGHILKSVPEVDKEDRKDVMRRLSKVMDLRNAHAHGTLITKGDEVYLRFYRNGMKIKLLDNNYWEDVEETLNGLFPRLQHTNTAIQEYINPEDKKERKSAPH